MIEELSRWEPNQSELTICIYSCIDIVNVKCNYKGISRIKNIWDQLIICIQVFAISTINTQLILSTQISIMKQYIIYILIQSSRFEQRTILVVMIRLVKDSERSIGDKYKILYNNASLLLNSPIKMVKILLLRFIQCFKIRLEIIFSIHKL